MFSIDGVLALLQQYGAIIIFICLFFGIVGVPAPEETLLVIIGIFIHTQKVPMLPAVISALLGVYIGMLVAYFLGRSIGDSAFQKLLKRLKLNHFKVLAWQEKYEHNYKSAIIIGYFVPGVRQINPYLAGMLNIRIARYAIVSFIGAVIWTLIFITLGYLSAHVFKIPYQYLPLVGIVIALIFIIYFYIQKKRTPHK